MGGSVRPRWACKHPDADRVRPRSAARCPRYGRVGSGAPSRGPPPAVASGRVPAGPAKTAATPPPPARGGGRPPPRAAARPCARCAPPPRVRVGRRRRGGGWPPSGGGGGGGAAGHPVANVLAALGVCYALPSALHEAAAGDGGGGGDLVSLLDAAGLAVASMSALDGDLCNVYVFADKVAGGGGGD